MSIVGDPSASHHCDAERLPTLSSLHSAVVSNNDNRNLEQFATLQAHLEHVLTPALLEEVMYRLGLESDRQSTLVRDITPTSLPLCNAVEGALALRVLETGGKHPSRLATAHAHVLVGVVPFGREDATVEFLRATYDEPVDVSVFDPTAVPRRQPNLELRAGQTHMIRAGCDSFAILPRREPAVLLLAVSPLVTMFRWEHAVDSLRPHTIIPSKEDVTRTVDAIRLLVALNHRSAAPLIEQLASHEIHAVRWTAIRGLMALQPERALPLVIRASQHDPHPHVRAAAVESLKRLPSLTTVGS